MPTYTVQVNVNVPGVGDKTFVKQSITATSIEEAIELAKQDVRVEILAIQRTAP